MILLYTCHSDGSEGDDMEDCPVYVRGYQLSVN